MSCYEWERGSIKIPSKHWSGLKKAVRDAYNGRQDIGLSMSLALYYHLKETLKGRRNQHNLIEGELDKLEDDRGDFRVTRDTLKDSAFNAKSLGGGDWQFRIVPARYEEQYDFWFEVRNSILTNKNGKLTLQKPMKKHWPKATNKDRVFSIGEARIIFSDDTKKTVTWAVPENNHAVERAREHHIAKSFFFALNRIEWTRGSGGELVGNNEYNREDEYAGGGANYTTATYGPETKERQRIKRYPGSMRLPPTGITRRY